MRLLTAVCLLVATPLLANDLDIFVNSVEIWVQAMDSSGKVVSDLKPEDFEIYEDGRLMKPTCFDSPGAGGSNGSFVGTERLVIYVDLFNITPAEYSRIQHPLADFVRRIDTTKWEVFLAVFSSEGKLGMIGPTTETNKLAGFLEHSGGNAARDIALRDRQRELSVLLDYVVGGVQETSEVRMSPGSNAMFAAYRLVRSYAALEKEHSEFSLSAFESLSKGIESKSNGGHTSIVYISGGFNTDPGRSYYDLLAKVMEDVGENDQTNAAVFNPDTNRENNFDLDLQFQRAIGNLNRSNITAYALNTRGNSVDRTAVYNKTNYRDFLLLEDFQASLARIASDTGGTVFEDSNNFDKGLQRVAYDIGTKYVLCYDPPVHENANEYHKIKVVVKKEGINLRYRQGYVD